MFYVPWEVEWMKGVYGQKTKTREIKGQKPWTICLRGMCRERKREREIEREQTIKTMGRKIKREIYRLRGVADIFYVHSSNYILELCTFKMLNGKHVCMF